MLIDPPFEAQDEFARIAESLEAGLKRFPSGVYAVWYPLTTRARASDFLVAVSALKPRSALAVELTVAGEASSLKMRGCGVAVINPPWQFEAEASQVVSFLARALAQEPGGEGRVEWFVREGGA
jgi:23S rRNA (adenine2030-N6)-methyltransferase